MPYSVPWNEAFPAGTNAAGLIWEYIQQDKIAVRERLDDVFATTGALVSLAAADPYNIGNIRMGAEAEAKIIPGATHLSIRNAGDTEDNFLVLDAGDVSSRSSITAGTRYGGQRVVAGAIAGGFLTIDLSLSNVFRINLTENLATLTLNNPIIGFYMFELNQAVAGRTVVWPGTFKWPNSVDPTLSLTLNKIDLISAFWDGTNFYGVVSGANY